MRRFALVTNRSKDPEGKMTDRALDIINRNGGECTCCLFKDKAIGVAYTSIDKSLVPKDTELIISLGGDGSFMHTAKDLIDLNIPIMGVNLGNLGYLTEMDLDGFGSEFRHIIDDEYTIEERMLLNGSIIRGNDTVMQDIAINDIVLNRLGTMNIISFDIFINGSFLNTYNADGYIICTPTGSTGYNLSAGGPVAHPESEVIITTPICAHTLNSRSVIFSADARIDVIIREKADEAGQIKAISFDGDDAIVLKNGDTVRVTRSEKKMRNLRLEKMSFVEHLGKKMR